MDRRTIFLKQFTKYSIYVLTIFILYVLQSTPGFLQIFGIKPVFIIPFCITLSMIDESWQAGIVFIIGGLLTDLSSGRVVGTYTLGLLFACAAGFIAVKFFFKQEKRNYYFFTFVAMTMMLTVDFCFSYVLVGYQGKLSFYLKNVVALSAYSAMFTNIFYRFIDYINLKFLRFDAR